MMKLLGLITIAALCACGGGHNNSPDASGAADGSIDVPGTGIDAMSDAMPDAIPPDAAPTFGLTSIFPAAASRTVNTALTISGFGINGTPTIHLTNCDQPQTGYDLTALTVTSTTITTSIAADLTRVQGIYTVTVTNGDALVASLTCAFRIVADPPPTVTVVVPTTAYRGMPNDNINSDATISILGTGFQSTPSIRWVSTTDPTMYYDAVFVGFASSTQLTAIVPSETLMMPVGTYNVFVTNPNNLTAEWMNNGTPGVFTITDTPPPNLIDVNPARITNNGCTTTILTLTGTGFATGATVWYVAPPGTVCAGSTTDGSGQILCPITTNTTAATSITAHFPTCPATGPYPVVVINPDGQADYFFSIEVTPSSDGHLNTGPFELQQNRLETARWKHAIQYGFDAFSNSIVYVAGGQDTAGNVLGSVEASLFNVFGTPGPFRTLQQYGGPTTPRVPNNLATPREGSTLVRTGKSLFSIGGTTVRSDVITPVAGSHVVERAQILSYAEMPGVKKPVVVGATGLPTGSWYYRVSAIGAWGESLATREVVAINKGGQLQVCWVAPQTMGAVSYNVYRSLASDGRAGTSAALAYEVGAATLCFTDDGLENNTPAPGNARGIVAAGGSLVAGSYSYRIAAVVPLMAGGTFETYAGYVTSTTISASDVTAGNQSVQVGWDGLAAAGVTYRVFRLDPTTATYKLITGANALTTTSFTDGGVAFDASGATPRTEISPLPTGSLARWNGTTTPQLLTAREGLDGVVIRMDPATSNNLVARILVAGGRDGTGGAYTYHTTAESLGVYMDGTTDAAWSAETPVFANARAYYALLTTQDRNVTDFPPPPDPPPCGDCNTVINHEVSSHNWWVDTNALLSRNTLLSRNDTPPVRTIANVVGAEPVQVVAVMGDDGFAASNNQGRDDFEACAVNAVTGRLGCGATWTVQAQKDQKFNFGADAVLYFSFLYPFYGIGNETVGGTTTAIQFINSAIGRFRLFNLSTIINGQILESQQSASTSYVVKRAYYQMTRLLAYVYVVGGWAEAHTENGVAVPAGPTGLVERHVQ